MLFAVSFMCLSFAAVPFSPLISTSIYTLIFLYHVVKYHSVFHFLILAEQFSSVSIVLSLLDYSSVFDLSLFPHLGCLLIT